MHRWKRLARTTVVAASAAVLVTGLSTSAQAASGTFAYNRADTGFREVMENPADDECIVMPGGGGVVDNFTDTVATLYRDEECTLPQDTLPPNSGGVYGGATVPHSVFFG
ncbi:hypothetical protein AB0B50_19915 [Streptomyces sp. NPDC041068]|uniref:hypothetical protein n=1 Tax=Streptomyces sp. NPDC041068 TaxID=3155130 RepID=UPI0033EE171B